MSKMQDYFRQMYTLKEDKDYWENMAWYLAYLLAHTDNKEYHDEDYWIDLAKKEMLRRKKELLSNSQRFS